MKDIRSNFVKESILDYENLANSLKENTSNIVKDLLNEAIKETYTKILTESDEDEYEVEEVDDTESEESNEANEESQTDESSEEETSLDEPTEDESEEEIEDVEVIGDESEEEIEDGEDEWAEFDKYKVSDGEYDFSEANDDEIVKVYKLLKDEDQVLVNADKESGKVEIKDNQTGAEYLIDLGCMNNCSNGVCDNDNSDFGGYEADDEEEYDEENMNESRVYELVLNEFDSHVGYTTEYQHDDVMTNPGTKEPGKNVNDWDAGVPKGDSKPWPGKNGNSKPFEKKVNESEDDEMIDEANLSQTRWNDTHAVHNRVPAANGDEYRRDGMQKTSKGTKYRPHGTSEIAAESKKMFDKVNKILKENEELKNALNKFKTVLQEAAVTNYNLGQIVKLISENTTSKDEKKEIINRFNEAKTIDQSKQLFESIACELKKKQTMNINEEKQFTANSSKMINETQIYKSKDLLDSLDLMHRLCK